MYNDNVSLIHLVEQDLGPGRRYGRWTMFRCPFHADQRPSLGVTDGDNDRGPYWKCFDAACGRHGSAYGWLLEYRQMSKADAWALFNCQSTDAPSRQMEDVAHLSSFSLAEETHDPTSRLDTPPGEAWQRCATELVERAQQALWKQGKRDLLDWTSTDLKSGQKITQRLVPFDWLMERGLNVETLQLWKIGYIPKDWKADPKRWGLEGTALRIPRGILIPCLLSNQIWYLKIRLPQGSPKYVQVRGSRPALYMVQTLEFSDVTIFCEGEFDCLRLWQDAWDLAGMATMGSAGNNLSATTWGIYLLHTRRRFVAYDMDEAGIKGANHLDWLSPTRLIIPPTSPFAKDLTDFACGGGDLRGWIQGILSQDTHPKEE